ncbi:hypothetical protein BKA67DRAFT_539188 [Truncatella angustata]|uniref:Uncharacterized protein n=1 Tax=Truncatella angustata TaxID=152316 RepID=A0A9P8RK53_9PEZI|nr:uncharacterized protein BKA67DRAFT_539188 [Truncatella angustata]KAH6647311.1 hypothetical protein BKA67DRAFT_539188 [Truncatella angustata]
MRRSQRLSSSGNRSRYFDNDVDDSEGSVAPLKTAYQRVKPKAKTVREGSRSSDVQLGDADIDTSYDENSFGSHPALPRKRGRPVKVNPNKRPADNHDVEVDLSRKRGRPVKVNPNKRPADNHDVEVDLSRKRGRGRPARVTDIAVAGSGSRRVPTTKTVPEDDNDEADENDSDGESPQVEFIPLPKLRETGGIDYEPQIVHPNTMVFLQDLKENNKRSWLKMRDPEFRRSLKDWESFVETLTDKIIESDETIPELPLKDVIFRIYRDIRFSKDPTPYKPHYSAAWSRTGRKGPYACYYVHCEPGSCFVGGGLWHPDKDALAKLRANIDERPHRLRRVLMNPNFRRAFLPKANNNEAAVIAAFCQSNQENALKTRPQANRDMQGFHPEHRDIELLKLRNYTVGQKIKDSDLTSSNAQDKIMAIIDPMVEYVTFLNSVVMPDPNFDSDSDQDD